MGTSSLNQTLQNILNPGKNLITRGTQGFRTGDKIMQLRNNYDKDVYNGDLGSIDRIDIEMQQAVIRFDDRKLLYDFSELDEIVLAYAISIHKSQGSEYPAIVLPIVTQHYVLLQRNLIYTALTRGKKLAVLVGTKKALAIGIGNDQPQRRFSYLDKRLSLGEQI